MPAEKIDFPARLMACLDIYQALSENRPYRNGMPFEQSYSIMKKLAQENAIEKDIVYDFIPKLRDFSG
jgi:HD-GYP domain-containing protein (c-di-GMP phosphodiesterase class II)